MLRRPTSCSARRSATPSAPVLRQWVRMPPAAQAGPPISMRRHVLRQAAPAALPVCGARTAAQAVAAALAPWAAWLSPADPEEREATRADRRAPEAALLVLAAT